MIKKNTINNKLNLIKNKKKTSYTYLILYICNICMINV